LIKIHYDNTFVNTTYDKNKCLKKKSVGRTRIVNTNLITLNKNINSVRLLFYSHPNPMNEKIDTNLRQGSLSNNLKPSLDYLEQVLIGILLGDGHLEKSSKGSGALSRLRITFAEKYKELAIHIADIFKDYMSTKSIRFSEVKNKDSSKLYKRITITSKVSPLFNYYHQLFYVENSDHIISNDYYNSNLKSKSGITLSENKDLDNLKIKYIKRIPSNIEELLTPVVLAYFICGDGNYHKTTHIIRLCTNSYTKTEVELFAKALHSKFNIESRLEHVRNNQYIIVIRKSQVPLLQNLIKEHIHPSMLYRIGLSNINS
jgi:hypothetical protein